MKHKTILASILFIAAMVRFCGISFAPVALNWDEASLGYNAYSILKTGRDEWGTFLPTIFPAFGDYKLPVYVYGSVLPIAVFGLNAFSVRFLSALSGVLAVWGIYLLTNLIFKKEENGLTNKDLLPGHYASLIMALLPWHIFLSRPALEANLGLTLFIFGLFFLLKSLTEKASLIYAAILFGLSMHTYNSYRVLVPLTIVFFVIYYYKEIPFLSKQFFTSLLIGICSASIVVFQLRTGQATARYEKLKILNPNLVYQIGQNRTESNLNPLLSKLVHNRPVYFAKEFTKYYFSYFTPQFWNQSKGAQYQFAIPGQNLATYPVLFLSVLGIFSSLFINKNKQLAFLCLIFFLSPVAAALTADPPQAIRPSAMISILPVVSIVGLFFLLKLIPKTFSVISLLLLITFLCFSFSYLQKYWNSYQLQYSSSWQYGYKEVFEVIARNKGNYNNIFITKKYGEPHIFHLFYNQVDPKIIQDSNETTRFAQTDWLWTDRIQNTYFLNDWEIPISHTSTFKLESGQAISAVNSILVTTPDHIPENGQIIDSISFLDGKIAFIIVKIP